MEKVLSITARLESKKRKEQVETYRERFEAIQRVLQCSACQFKCAMCNRHIEPDEESDASSPPEEEFNLCESCLSEFEAFKKMSGERSDKPDVFWHNREWLELWKCWMAYQRSINNFRNSFNFSKLTD